MARMYAFGLFVALLLSNSPDVASAEPPAKPLVVDFLGRLVALKNNDKQIGVRFDMSEATYLRYQRMIATKEMKGIGDPILVGLADEQLPKRQATIERFEPEFDVRTGTIGVYAILTKDDHFLLPGMTTRVRMTLEHHKP